MLNSKITFSSGAFGFYMSLSERKTIQDDWERHNRTFSTTFIITDICTRRGGEELYVSGITGAGNSVVQKWIFPRREGRHRIDFFDPPPILGIPIAPPARFKATMSIEGAGGWVGGNRGAIPAPIKTNVYEGSVGPFTRIQVDPEGRFLLFYDFTEKAIKQIVLSDPPGEIQTLYTAQDNSELSQLHDFEFRDSATFGRVCAIWRNYPGKNLSSDEIYTLLFDTDNDGVFDSIESYGLSAYKITPYWGASDWVMFNR